MYMPKGMQIIKHCFYMDAVQRDGGLHLVPCGMLLEDHTNRVLHIFREPNNRVLLEVKNDTINERRREGVVRASR